MSGLVPCIFNFTCALLSLSRDEYTSADAMDDALDMGNRMSEVAVRCEWILGEFAVGDSFEKAFIVGKYGVNEETG